MLPKVNSGVSQLMEKKFWNLTVSNAGVNRNRNWQ